jgi:hypothetical protein
MKDKILNEATIIRYKLNQIPMLNREECIDALQLLNYLYRRAEGDETRKELEVYIDLINRRVEAMG